jgi:hypothetical protein
MYYYKNTEPGLWTVGIDTADGWDPESDHDSIEEARERVRILNGGNLKPELSEGELWIKVGRDLQYREDLIRSNLGLLKILNDTGFDAELVQRRIKVLTEIVSRFPDHEEETILVCSECGEAIEPGRACGACRGDYGATEIPLSEYEDR